MADTAFQKQYRQEFVKGFEQRQSLLRDSTTTEAVIKGNTAEFLVADSGDATAVTRGANGRIPGRADSLTANTCTLTEWHDKPEKTGFNIFAGQGDQRRLMQETSMAVINRKIDSQILTALATSTVDTGATYVTADLSLVLHAKTILGVNKVPFDGNICAAISPAFEAYLLQTKEFGSAEYVGKKPLDGDETAWDDQVGYYRWLGVKWIVHTAISGIGGATEKCLMYHKSAIGHAANVGAMDSKVGYNDEDDYSFARSSMFMGAKLLQNSGVVVMHHDGSAYAAA